jgi:hypothetical protein
MVRSVDSDLSSFLAQLDRSLEASRDVFKLLDAELTILSEQDWMDIQLKVWIVVDATGFRRQVVRQDFWATDQLFHIPCVI